MRGMGLMLMWALSWNGETRETVSIFVIECKYSNAVQITHQDVYIYVGKLSKEQLKFISQPALGYDSDLLRPIWIPIKLFAFPIIEWASFVFSWSASCFLAMNLTQSQAFAVPPYNFNSFKIGYFNLAMFVGSTAVLLTAGPF
ncbi:hypothetical protein V1522DRAFT_55511 [Lipomyces starkeyi]